MGFLGGAGGGNQSLEVLGMSKRSWLGLGLALALAGATACDDDADANAPGTEETSGGMPEVAPPNGTGHEEPAADPSDHGAGPVVDDPSYELRAEATGPFHAGQLGQLAVRLTPKTGWHVNQEYPISVRIHAPSGLAFPKTELARADAAEFGEQMARFDVPFTPSAAGEHHVQCDVSFAVCTEENCVPDDQTLSLVVPVE